MGIEYGAVVVVCTLLGYWVDRHWQIEEHWGTLIGALIGLVGGTYNFVRDALKAVRDGEQQRPTGKRPGGAQPRKADSPSDRAPGGPHDVDGSGRE
jgi:F0F1-type ATP synthase assembly protein I